MKREIVQSSDPVLLFGGGECMPKTRQEALEDAKRLDLRVVAADGGASGLLAAGWMPDAVIGDMDSLSQAEQEALAPGVLHPIAEQDSTDFDKCLRNIAAPLVLAHGFFGARLDHQLAVLTVLARHPERRCLLVGEDDVAVLCPPAVSLPLEAGTRVSLYPLGPVSGCSTGLFWPIDGLEFAPWTVVGTSNEATGPVTLQVEAPLMLLILPRSCLAVLRAALAEQPVGWPARAK